MIVPTVSIMPRTCTTRPKASRDPARIEQALDALLRRISDGWEFPDAAWYIARKFAVDQRALEAAYDRR